MMMMVGVVTSLLAMFHLSQDNHWYICSLNDRIYGGVGGWGGGERQSQATCSREELNPGCQITSPLPYCLSE